MKLFSLESYSLQLAKVMCRLHFQVASKLVRKCSADDKAAYVAAIGDEAAVQSNTDIFRSLRKLRVGSSFRKRAITPLPQLNGKDGDAASTWEERDDIWLRHCATMEAGVPTTSQRLIARIQEKSFIRAASNPQRSIEEVPTLGELEQAFRRIRPRKAPGADCLRSDLCHLAPAALARAYFPLLFKVTLNYNEPLQMKGGVLVAAFKGGNSSEVDSYRSLLLSSHLGKALRRTVRQRLVCRYAAMAPSLHVSVKAGGNVMHASHALRSYLLSARRKQYSAAIIFLDVKSAYYRVIRQLAANLTCADEDIARVLRYFDLEEKEMGNLLRELQEISAMKRAGAEINEELITEEFLYGTWFVTKSRRQLVESLAGTRPGDGLADVIFSYVFHRVMDKVNQELRECLGWPTTEGMEDYAATTTAPPNHDIAPAIDVIWADDLAYGVAANTAQETVEQVQQVASALFSQCLAHGMRPNMSRNKTEVMLQIRGPQSRQLKRQFYDCQQPVLHLQDAPPGYQDVRLTGAYKHLGYQVQVSDMMMAEIKSRTGQAQSVFRSHRKQVFMNPRLPLSKRKYIFQSLVLSILRYNLGTWPYLKPKEMDYFSARLLSMYRCLARPTVGADDLRIWNNDRVISYLELPTPSVILQEAVLRYGISLYHSGPKMLWLLLGVEGEWLQRFRDAVAWMQSNLRGYGPNKLGQPFAPDWEAWFRQNNEAVKSWISKARQHSVMQHCIQIQWKEWHHQFLQECAATGLDISYPWAPFDRQREDEQKLEACLACHKLVRSKAAWSVHAFKKHQRVNWRRRFVHGSQCPICMNDYSTTTRLLLHLTYSKACSALLKDNVNEVDVKPGRNSRKVDKDRLLSVPVIKAAGPTPEWIQNQEAFDPELDQSLFQQFCETSLLIDEETVIAEAVEEFKRIMEESASAFSNVCHTWRSFLNDVPMPEAPEVNRRWRSIHTMVDDQLRLRWFFEDVDFEEFGTQPTDEALRDNAWKFCSEDRRFPTWRNDHYNPYAGFRDFVLVHLFSGERRENDLEHFLCGVILPQRAFLVVLSVDIIYDSCNANLADPAIQLKWHGFMRRGLIHALYAGPPCETWSVARIAGGIAAYSRGDGGPRVVRTMEWIMGMPALTIKEAKQILIGNLLLTFALMSVLIMAGQRRLAVMEHPEEGADDWVASSWKLHATKLLSGHPRIEVFSILQGRYGGVSPKPTKLLISADDRNTSQRVLESFAVTSLPKGIRLGRNETGEYNTSQLKNYPPLLCEALAALAQSWCSKYYHPGIETNSDDDFLQFVDKLKSSYNLSAQRGPDFAF